LSLFVSALFFSQDATSGYKDKRTRHGQHGYDGGNFARAALRIGEYQHFTKRGIKWKFNHSSTQRREIAKVIQGTEHPDFCFFGGG